MNTQTLCILGSFYTTAHKSLTIIGKDNWNYCYSVCFVACNGYQGLMLDLRYPCHPLSDT